MKLLPLQETYTTAAELTLSSEEFSRRKVEKNRSRIAKKASIIDVARPPLGNGSTGVMSGVRVSKGAWIGSNVGNLLKGLNNPSTSEEALEIVLRTFHRVPFDG